MSEEKKGRREGDPYVAEVAGRGQM